MYLCYIDESGTPQIPGNTSHYVLTGISIPIWIWKSCEVRINRIKNNHHLRGTEIHTAWILREYRDQYRITNFSSLSHQDRRTEVQRVRRNILNNLQRRNPSAYHQTKKNFNKTEPYIHLTLDEIQSFIEDIAKEVRNWSSARLFAECVDKDFFNPGRTRNTVDEQAFEQVVSRFEQYLKITEAGVPDGTTHHGILIHDNNPSCAKRHTELMKKFHRRGTLWTSIENVMETPLFVDSSLTSMVQIADLCAYSLRRYLENNEEILFDYIFERADKKDDVVVGVRHFTDSCNCKICQTHTK